MGHCFRSEGDHDVSPGKRESDTIDVDPGPPELIPSAQPRIHYQGHANTE